jgi:hypothetical protein
MEWKKILLSFGKWLLKLGASLAFKYADKDKNGEVSAAEWNAVIEELELLVSKK